MHRGPERRIELLELRDRVHACIQKLPPRCREVATLVLEEDMTHGAAAERLGVTPKAIEKQVQRMRKRLASDLVEVAADWFEMDVQESGRGGAWP